MGILFRHVVCTANSEKWQVFFSFSKGSHLPSGIDNLTTLYRAGLHIGTVFLFFSLLGMAVSALKTNCQDQNFVFTWHNNPLKIQCGMFEIFVQPSKSTSKVKTTSSTHYDV